MKKRPLLLAASLVQLLFAAAVDAQTAERISAAAENDAVDALPRTAFYETDAALARGESGTLIRAEEFGGYDLPADVRATRILYRSRSELDHEVVASAVVIVPTRAAPPGGWPFVIWAHGVLGVAQKCAPSLSKSLGPSTQTLVKEGVSRGFAVVAVDYSGLGAGSQHEYLWKTANAKDIIFAAPAARAAQPGLASSWVAMGYSEGGQAVWGVAEVMATLHDPSYRGAVALAPTVDTETLIPRVGALPGHSFYPVYAAFGIKAVYPNFDTHSILLPAAVNAYPRLTGKECRNVGSASFEPVKLPAVLEPRWTAAPLVRRLLTANEVGKKPIAGPMLVAAADGDTSVPQQLLATRVKTLCSTGATVDYQVYPGDHESMLVTSLADQMSWIGERFQGRPPAGNCQR